MAITIVIIVFVAILSFMSPGGVKNCKDCGAEIWPDDKHCPKCGRHLPMWLFWF